MGAAVVTDLHPQHLVENAALNVGDDTVGHSRQHHLLAVGRQALDRVNGHDRCGDLPNRLEIAADEDLVDNLADDPGRERRGHRDQPHHRKGEEIALPVLGALIREEAAQERVRGRVENMSRCDRAGRARVTMVPSFAGSVRRPAFRSTAAVPPRVSGPPYHRSGFMGTGAPQSRPRLCRSFCCFFLA